MSRPSDEDLFKDSTMSFGEHLDELRTALFKSVIAIMFGFLVGLYVGPWVVVKLQDPLIAALKKYYVEGAEEDFLARIAEREQAGEKVPQEFKDPAYVRKLIRGDRLLFEEAYLDPATLLKEFQVKFPDQFSGIKLPERHASEPPQKSDLIRVLLWHTIEDDPRVRVISLSSEEPFMILMKVALVTGIVLSSPAVFYFIWQFVAAGLYPQEKSYVHIFLPFSIGLFLTGVLLAFFFVFPPVLNFFLSFNKWLNIDSQPRITEWLNFVLLLPIVFGLSFQLPLIMLFLQRIGVFTTESYLSSWRIAILVMAVVAMVITPTGDPQTMLMLLIPLTILYFGGILLCKWMPGGGTRRKDLRTG
jgi:sec-independent protein translocase protein TatC